MLLLYLWAVWRRKSPNLDRRIVEEKITSKCLWRREKGTRTKRQDWENHTSYPGQENNFGGGRLRLVKTASRDLGVIS